MANDMPKHGIFCWNELMTRDPKAAGRFYTELIGWNATDSGMHGMDYTIMKVGETQAAGLMAMPASVPKEVPSHWMSYITVDDVDSLVDKVAKLGGQVLYGPEDVPNVGRFMTIVDPTGAAVSLMAFPKK